jgi:RNA polymerase sigma factor (sigma-70 family)
LRSVTLTPVTDPAYDESAERHYASLYRFGLSLTQNESEARDLVQQVFYLLAAKGHQVRDASKIKSWLFTTLYREYLAARRRRNRFPHVSLEVLEDEPVCVSTEAAERMDAGMAIAALSRLDGMFRAPLALFYLENLSYKQIAETLGIPVGTVMSRLARGKEQLRQILAKELNFEPNKTPSQAVLKPQSHP